MPKTIHFGIGNFHRAHQAWYTQLANAFGGPQWRITGVSLRSAAIRDALADQAFSYTLALNDAAGAQHLKMDVHDDILVGSTDGEKIIALIADPDTQVITITVSEKGYHLDPNSGQLDLSSAAIATEIASRKPSTVIGYIAHGLAKRYAAHTQPINIISCDNLPENGTKLRKAVSMFCATAGIEITDYLRTGVSFPNTMVDRIVPATTDTLRAQIQAATGEKDTHPIATETFSEWYIEDALTADIPAWDQVGVRIVNDVAPFELRKLRMLNGAHSYLAYAGLNAGHRYVHDAIADPTLLAGATALMAEAADTLPHDSKSKAQDYAAALIERFQNPNLNHELRQIAMDGSLKLPIRILPVIAQHRANGSAAPAQVKALQEWSLFISKHLRAGASLDDPHRDRFTDLANKFKDDTDLRQALLNQLSVSVQQ